MLLGNSSCMTKSQPLLRKSITAPMEMSRTGSVPHQLQSNAVDPTDSEALRVMILVNGGPVSFESVHLALRYGCPVVICRDSGRAADFLAALKDKRCMDHGVVQ